MGAGRPEKRNEKGAIAPFALACFVVVVASGGNYVYAHLCTYAHFACSPQISAGHIC